MKCWWHCCQHVAQSWLAAHLSPKHHVVSRNGVSVIPPDTPYNAAAAQCTNARRSFNILILFFGFNSCLYHYMFVIFLALHRREAKALVLGEGSSRHVTTSLQLWNQRVNEHIAQTKNKQKMYSSETVLKPELARTLTLTPVIISVNMQPAGQPASRPRDRYTNNTTHSPTVPGTPQMSNRLHGTCSS